MPGDGSKARDSANSALWAADSAHGETDEIGGFTPQKWGKKKITLWLPGGIHQLRLSEQRKQKLRNEAGTTGMFHSLWLTCSVLVAKQKLFFLKAQNYSLPDGLMKTHTCTA